MDSDNLIFSNKIDPDVEDICFELLLDHLSEVDYDRVYVKNVVLAGKEIIFFTNIDGKESIIRIRV